MRGSTSSAGVSSSRPAPGTCSIRSSSTARPSSTATPSRACGSCAVRSTSRSILRAECVSLWSGVVPDGMSRAEAWPLLVGRMREIVAYAEASGVVLGFEPEPGMLVETVADALRLRDELGAPDGAGHHRRPGSLRRRRTRRRRRRAARGGRPARERAGRRHAARGARAPRARQRATRPDRCAHDAARDRIPRAWRRSNCPATRTTRRAPPHAACVRCARLGRNDDQPLDDHRRGRHHRGTAAHRRAVPRRRARGRARAGRSGCRSARAPVRHGRRRAREQLVGALLAALPADDCGDRARRPLPVRRRRRTARRAAGAERRTRARSVRRPSSTRASSSSPTRCARTTRGWSPPRSATSPARTSTITPGGTAC